MKFRNLHVGKEHHIFHLHAHQWLATPDDPDSSYLDSEAIGPGSGYTYEIAYGGSGNRNKTPGDSIFHCHFYPHFAQGMWALWRVHDSFEPGTVLDGTGRPAAGSRALPDGEIPAGTPIPALVPIPGQAMAPMPGSAAVAPADANGNGIPDSSQIVVTEPDANGDGLPDRSLGFPFYIPGKAGHRPPSPPLDIAKDANGNYMDGGLSRHIITGGQVHSTVNPQDFNKELYLAVAEYIPEDGTAAEKAAMAFHALPYQATYKPDGTAASFQTNGLPASQGAAFAEPCRTDSGTPIPVNRTYKGANIELDIKINKASWHFPQSRILTLWDDVAPTLNGSIAPEPFVMRANTGDCVSYYHTNLTPGVYQQDAFQVKTPTDIMGQHIHLVKFDVMTADGSANGFNYEDGTFSPDEVRERIRAIRAQNGCAGNEISGPEAPGCPVAKPHAELSQYDPEGKWLGARTTMQKWYVDALENSYGQDRTLGNVYTHDHYGPSTHQQVGMYSTLITEPKGSQWRNPETGKFYGTRSDGGPTSWHADILTANPSDSFREFYLEFQDFQLAYDAGRGVNAQGKPIPDAMGAINPPGMKEIGLPDLFARPLNCPNGAPFDPSGCPEAISADDPGTFSVNYRSEPLAMRVRDPNGNKQTAGLAGDLSYAFESRTDRADARFNVQPNFYPPLTADVRNGDPYTPMMRVYDGDKIRIRIQVGATEEGHNFSAHGLKWLQEFSSPNSGWRNSQMLGISEQFILESPVPVDPTLRGKSSDYLWTVSSSVDGLWPGNWGIMRSYGAQRQDLMSLPNNTIPSTGWQVSNLDQFSRNSSYTCPVNAPVRQFDVTAVLAKNALPGETLVYNNRTANGGPLHDPTAIMYVRSSDLGANGKLEAGVPVEPLVLRAAAGDCISFTLRNRLLGVMPDLDGYNALPPIVDGFNANDVKPSSIVGLRPQLLAYDVTRGEGANVGTNGDQTAAPGTDVHYWWYAGNRVFNPADRKVTATPVEFGATNLISSDRIKHSNKGAIGALIIEPRGSTWVEDASSRSSATIKNATSNLFREFVLQLQTDLNLRMGRNSLDDPGTAVPFIMAEHDSEDSGNKAVNYRSEPLWFRLGIPPGAVESQVARRDFTNVYSNVLTGGNDPVTPVLKAAAGEAVRFRVLGGGGHARNNVFTVHGHDWQKNPYINGSSEIGNNPLSERKGTQEGLGPTNHWDFVLDGGAGGKFGIKGDYLYRDLAPTGGYQGLWGILRVGDPPSDSAPVKGGKK